MPVFLIPVRVEYEQVLAENSKDEIQDIINKISG